MNGRVRGTNPTEQTVSLRHALVAWCYVPHVTEGIPDADEFDFDVGRECFLERVALSPANIVIATEHLVRERNLLVVARREKTHLRLGQIAVTCN